MALLDGSAARARAVWCTGCAWIRALLSPSIPCTALRTPTTSPSQNFLSPSSRCAPNNCLNCISHAWLYVSSKLCAAMPLEKHLRIAHGFLLASQARRPLTGIFVTFRCPSDKFSVCNVPLHGTRLLTLLAARTTHQETVADHVHDEDVTWRSTIGRAL